MTNENSIAFAKKLGFQLINEKDWMIDIETLRDNIAIKSQNKKHDK